MKRYQVYLNPHSVAILDEFESHTQISRSKLIREAIDRLAENLAQIFTRTKTPAQRSTFDELIGFIKAKNKTQTDYAKKSDKLYLVD